MKWIAHGWFVLRVWSFVAKETMVKLIGACAICDRRGKTFRGDGLDSVLLCERHAKEYDRAIGIIIDETGRWN